MPRFLGRLVCFLKGHDWETDGYDKPCHRCGIAPGSGPPEIL